MIIVGIVGPPAGGKSTAARAAASRGAVWLNADAVAHEVLQHGEIQAALREQFGPQVVRDGQVDRRWLAGQVFGDDPRSTARLQWLEKLIHPPTRRLLTQRLRQAAQEAQTFALLDVPLLFESSWDLSCDQIWCVDAALEDRVRWVAARGWTREQLIAREQRQLPLAEKKRLSTHVLQNDGPPAWFIQQVDRLCDAIASSANRLAQDGHCETP